MYKCLHCVCGGETMMTSGAHWSLPKPQITSSWQFPFGNFSTVSLYVLIFPNKFGNTNLYTIFEYWFQVCSCILCLMLNPKQCTSESWIWSACYKCKDSDSNSEPQKFLRQEKVRFELLGRSFRGTASIKQEVGVCLRNPHAGYWASIVFRWC